MVPLTNPAELAQLLEHKQLLYKKLLDCSNQQLILIDKRDEEKFPVLFEQTANQWDSLVKQIESVQEELNTRVLSDSKVSEVLIEIIQQIGNNIDTIEKSLQKREVDLEENMSSVNNQKKIMRAYYGAHFIDSSSIYFDEKK